MALENLHHNVRFTLEMCSGSLLFKCGFLFELRSSNHIKKRGVNQRGRSNANLAIASVVVLTGVKLPSLK